MKLQKIPSGGLRGCTRAAGDTLADDGAVLCYDAPVGKRLCTCQNLHAVRHRE